MGIELVTSVSANPLPKFEQKCGTEAVKCAPWRAPQREASIVFWRTFVGAENGVQCLLLHIVEHVSLWIATSTWNHSFVIRILATQLVVCEHSCFVFQCWWRCIEILFIYSILTILLTGTRCKEKNKSNSKPRENIRVKVGKRAKAYNLIQSSSKVAIEVVLILLVMSNFKYFCKLITHTQSECERQQFFWNFFWLQLKSKSVRSYFNLFIVSKESILGPDSSNKVTKKIISNSNF